MYISVVVAEIIGSTSERCGITNSAGKVEDVNRTELIEDMN